MVCYDRYINFQNTTLGIDWRKDWREAREMEKESSCFEARETHCFGE